MRKVLGYGILPTRVRRGQLVIVGKGKVMPPECLDRFRGRTLAVITNLWNVSASESRERLKPTSKSGTIIPAQHQFIEFAQDCRSTAENSPCASSSGVPHGTVKGRFVRVLNRDLVFAFPE